MGKSLRQRGGGAGYSVSVEDGSIAGQAVYTGYDSRQAPLFVGGITNDVNEAPMVGNPESPQVPPITRGYDYNVASAPSGDLSGAPLAELGRPTQSGGKRSRTKRSKLSRRKLSWPKLSGGKRKGNKSALDREVQKLIEQFRGISKQTKKLF